MFRRIRTGNRAAPVSLVEACVLGGLAAALLVYLGYTLLRPDRF
ncbi:MAG: potassium-transporting ATPase subunit F [Actinobacteria bacterium]|nr:potassium-transporting ATPase subunit F [Actinomycetota bacterium]